MRLRLIPREESFFDLFEKLAATVSLGAEELLAVLSDFTDVERKTQRVLDIEHEGDELTHEVIRRLNTSFITPFDREDIHHLASGLDDVLDNVEAAAEYLRLHAINEPLPQMVSMAQTLARAATITAEAMPRLRDLKNLDDYWVEINRLENEGDRFYRRTIAELFSGDHKAMDVLKYKEIIEEIEAAMDRLEDVANIVESIVLKQG
jgi:predicted phosphate transport protein (TIGR00153 family)